MCGKDLECKRLLYVLLLLWVRKEVIKKSVKKLKMVENNLLTAFKRRGNVRVLFICHDWSAHSHTKMNFTFIENYQVR